jgi:hypothetical protein
VENLETNDVDTSASSAWFIDYFGLVIILNRKQFGGPIDVAARGCRDPCPRSQFLLEKTELAMHRELQSCLACYDTGWRRDEHS